MSKTNEHSSTRLASLASAAFGLRQELKAARALLARADKLLASLAGSVLTQARDKKR